MKDYRVTIKIQNNYMWRAMQRAGMRTAADLARASGVHATAVGELLNLRVLPVTKKGIITMAVERISVALQTSPENLFPPQHWHKALKRNTGALEMSISEVSALTRSDETPETILLRKERLRLANAAMKAVLSPRELDVLTRRWGLNGPAETLEETALHVRGYANASGRERMRQIEDRAIRKIREKISKRPLTFSPPSA